MALIRLVESAPWPKVELPSGLIVYKHKYEEQGNHSIRSISQWIEEYSDKEEITLPETPPAKPNYESMSKIDLRLLCKEKKIEYKESMKADSLVKLLKEYDENKKE